MYNSSIMAFSSYVPQKMVTNEQLQEVVNTSHDWIFSRTGICERRISTLENTSDIATNIAKDLLKKTNTDPQEIDLIIVATISPDYISPSTACIVQNNIGAKNAFCFDINAACSGFVYALSITDKFLKSGAYKKAIVIGAEVMSKLLNWQDRATCVLFGDGGGGAIIQLDKNKKAILSEDIHSDGNEWKSITAGKFDVCNHFSNIKQKNDDFYLKMNGREVFKFATKIVPKSILNVIEKAKLSFEQIKYIVPHQANLRIVEVIAKKLELSLNKFYLNLDKFGNTSAASIPIALDEMYRLGKIKIGDKVIITGFGAGLTWASMLIEI